MGLCPIGAWAWQSSLILLELPVETVLSSLLLAREQGRLRAPYRVALVSAGSALCLHVAALGCTAAQAEQLLTLLALAGPTVLTGQLVKEGS